MPFIYVKTSFPHADKGEIYPVYYEKGLRDVSERCAEVAVAEKWAVKTKKTAAEKSTDADGGQQD